MTNTKISIIIWASYKLFMGISMTKFLYIWVVILIAGCSGLMTEEFQEDDVPKYVLPPLVPAYVKNVKSYWLNERRAEVLEMFQTQMFGKVPKERLKIKSLLVDKGQVFEGTAERRQYELTLSNKNGELKIHLLVYRPFRKTTKRPFFLALNFRGNHTIDSDPMIRVHPDKEDEERGSRQSFWEVRNLTDQGIGLATAYYGDIDPDYDDDFKNGIHALFPNETMGESNFASIAAWAYGLSHLNDFLRNQFFVEKEKIVVMGHSRLGKTALYTSAIDTRFYGAISNNSGCGGAALSKREFGETLKDINTKFPHWFNRKFKSFNGRESELPFDQHMLLALSAPRKLYIASASKDAWADPKGEFLATKEASKLYKAFDSNSFEKLEFPKAGSVIHRNIGYHLRGGNHEVTKFDWNQFINYFFN